MIELAAAVWKTDVYETMERLQASDLGIKNEQFSRNNIDCYVTEHQNHRHRIHKMWEESQEYLEKTSSPTVRMLQRRFHLTLVGSRDRWQAGPGKLFGALSVRAINTAMTPNSVNKHGHSLSESRPFIGSKWDSVIVMPLFSLPHRIRSFMFMGRTGSPAADQVFKLVNAPGLNRSRVVDAGLGCLPAVEMSGNPSTIIATDDWLLALRVHMRVFKSSWVPAPLVVWQDNGRVRTTKSWNILGDKNIIFWKIGLDARTVRQAVAVEGQISVLGPTDPKDADRVGNFLRKYSGGDLINLIHTSARPWRKALVHWMNCNGHAAVNQLLEDLEELGEDVSYILRQCGRSEKIVSRPAVRREISVGGKIIVERGDRWMHEPAVGSPQLVMDAALRITHAIRDLRSGELYYRGYIRYQGNRLHFIEPATVMDGNVIAWIRNKITHAGLGLLQYATRWRSSNVLYEMATLFSTPQFVNEDLADHVHEMREAGHIEDPI